jgi:hypothetical protein
MAYSEGNVDKKVAKYVRYLDRLSMIPRIDANQPVDRVVGKLVDKRAATERMLLLDLPADHARKRLQQRLKTIHE